MKKKVQFGERHSMDEIDIGILEILRENARTNASQIGERINMSVSAVIERIRKLEDTGIIKQYTVILDSKMLGRDITAFISVRLEHPKYNDSFTAEVKTHPEIIECHYLAGDYDYIMKVITQSTGSLASTLNKIKSIKGVSVTKTLVVLSEVKYGVSVLPGK